MITGKCHKCGHKEEPISSTRDVVRLATNHGHRPQAVMLCCSCGQKFDIEPLKNLPPGLSQPEQIAWMFEEARRVWNETRDWIAAHASHTRVN